MFIANQSETTVHEVMGKSISLDHEYIYIMEGGVRKVLGKYESPERAREVFRKIEFKEGLYKMPRE